MRLNLNSILFTLLLLATANPLLAKSSDFTQAIDVQADSSEFDEKTGIQTLQGNVEIHQGSMFIKADSITVEIKEGRLSIIRGIGTPIKFQQDNEQGERVTGECAEIIYLAAEAQLILIGNATLIQPNRRLSGERIEFDSKNQTVKAEGGESGRVMIKIQPPPEKSQ